MKAIFSSLKLAFEINETHRLYVLHQNSSGSVAKTLSCQQNADVPRRNCRVVHLIPAVPGATTLLCTPSVVEIRRN